MTVTRDDVRVRGFTVDIAVDIHMQLPLQVWRILILSLADGRCTHCSNPANIHCHHIDGVRQNNCIANGMCLCARCHTWWHYLAKEDDPQAAIAEMQDERLMYLMSLGSAQAAK